MSEVCSEAVPQSSGRYSDLASAIAERLCPKYPSSEPAEQGSSLGALARGADEWPKDHRYALRLRELNKTPDATYETFRKGIESPDPVIAANVIIGLIRVTSFLLDRQLRQLERAFLEEGGLRERMTRARLAERNKARR